ncbi:MAG TPA: hypothetical protein VJ259_07300, partial [Actinomycetota bacterium]|nr:hypothetical protein [Actinomycetota bacterium]
AVVANLNADRLDGISAESLALATHDHDPVYVNVTGDTMTGTLALPDNGLSVGGTTPQLVVSSGNVGIGRSAPSVRLDVQADATGGAEEVLRVAVADAPSASLKVDNASPLPGVFVPRLDSVGSVTMTALVVQGRIDLDSGSEPALVLTTSTAAGQPVSVRPLVQFRNLSAPLMTLDAAGRVGIGTTAPASKLDVSGGSIRTDAPLVLAVPDGTPPLSVTSTAVVANLNADRLDGISAESLALATHDHDPVYVNVTGDTMTGTLALPDNGLSVGGTTPQLVVQAGNVGIGTGAPLFNLQTEGDSGGFFMNSMTQARAYVAGGSGFYRGWGVEAYGTYNPVLLTGGGGIFSDLSTGNYAAVGQDFSKIRGTGSVSFIQNHPYEKDKVIVYAAPEGDETAVYTRGTARLVNGEARLSLGETLQWVANPDIGLTAYVTPRGEAVPLAVVSVTPRELVVRAPSGGPRDVAFDYIVYGLRIGFEETSVVEEKTEEAFIPSMVNQRARDAERPELRAFNALERFKAAESAKGIDVSALDLSRAAALKAAIGEHDPAVHGPKVEGVQEPLSQDPNAAGPVAGRPDQPGSTTSSTSFGSTPVGDGSRADERDAYARSFRPSAPDLAGFVAVSEAVSSGDVLVADPQNPGVMRVADSPADPAVVGIVSGEPGVALGAGRARVGETDSGLAQQLEAARARGDEA